MATTAKDVAKRLGLSQSSVSRILSDTGEYRYSPETRERVLSVAAEMNYRPNAVARSLRTQRTNIIGLYCGYGIMNLSQPFVAEIINGLQTECDVLRNNLLLHTGFGVNTAEEIYNELANGKIDGVVLFTPPGDPLAGILAASSLPAVAVVNTVPHLPCVMADDAAGARLIAEHLAEKGHRRIMYRMGGAVSDGASVLRRLATFHELAKSYGMSVVETTEGEFLGKGLSAEERDLLTAPPNIRPTAAVCWHDSSAYGLIGACPSVGLRVPDDLAVVGFNGSLSEASYFCKLTTVRAPWAQVGRTAVKLLFDLIKGKEAPTETVLPVDLVIGETT